MDPGSGLVNDLATLSDLDEEILLQELRARYERDVIYTNVGDILIAVNPYRPLPIYGQDVAERYSNVSRLSSQLPHVFAVADRAYRTLCLTATNQCCVVSGESGAGKTETTKLLVQHIAFQCRYQRSDLHTRIVQVNPLLEAFGNAETLMNKNSSRFGKYIELSFSQDGSLYRAKLDEYLLEKSRVVSQGSEEKNFHVFYAMFAGLTSFELRKLVLEPPDNYRILNNQSGGPVYPNEDVFLYHKEEYARLYRVMEAVGFYPEDITMIYALLGAVLHVANIDFVSEEDNEGVYIINEYELDIASSLLGLNTEDLVSVLISNTSTVRGERIVSLKSLHQANDGRDALAKAVYSRLFSWIVRQINLMLDPIEDRPFVDKKDLRHIGILDMAGFENFPTNSFEQLCINVANEQLQFYFNQHVFAWEVQAYANEGIRHPKIKYNNNKPLLDLFLERPLGLLCLLDEECKFPRATDTTLVDKLNKNLSKSSHYKKSKHRELAFSIQHYAGPVKYQATGFLEKNRDTLSLNLIEILQKSASWIVHELFTARLSDTGTLDVRMKQSKGFLDSPPPSQATASLHFRNSLTDLTEKLLQADPQFIRCIKPNAVKSPSHFVPGIVLDQLRYTGVLETTRIRRNGFPTRLPFQTFLQRYGLIAFPVLPPPRESGEECAAVLHRAGIDHWQIGKTKVFLKYWHTEKLNMGVQKCLDSVKTIQNSVRTLVARKALKRLRLKSHKQAQEVELFCVQVQQQLDNIHTMLTEQQQQDAERHQRMLESRYPRNNQPIRLPGLSPDFDDIDSIIGYDKSRYYEVDNRPASEPVNIRQPPPVAPRPKIFRTTDEFTQVVVDDIVDRRPTLNDGIWCKVLYMERNHLVAKFYVEEPDISIDGSEEKYAGERVGLGYFKNARRDELTTRVRNEISRGIELRQDNEGSIIATRLGYADVVVSGYKEPQNHCLCRDLILNRGRLQYNTPIKIFDMKEFKSHIALELRHGTVNRDRLRRLCLVNLSFMTDIDDIIQSPCWMCVVNLTAFDSVHSPAVIREVRSSLISLVQQKSREEVNQNNQKRDSRAWSKVNQRPSSNITDIPRRNQKTARKINQAILHPRPTSPASVSSSSDSFDFHSSRDFFANLEDGRSASPSVSSNIKPLPRNNWAKLKALQKLQEEEASGKGHRSRKH